MCEPPENVYVATTRRTRPTLVGLTVICASHPAGSVYICFIELQNAYFSISMGNQKMLSQKTDSVLNKNEILYHFSDNLYNTVMPISYDCFQVNNADLEIINCFCLDPLNCLCRIKTLSALPNKSKFVYPKIDPQPSDIIDSRTEPQKMQSVLRTLSQFFTADQLEVWNNLVERNLHISSKFISGIP